MKRMLISFLSLVMTAVMFSGISETGLAAGSAPVAENLELKTYRNTSVGGTLSAFDPDGDSVCFEITTKPIKGEIELDDDGCFVYKPITNKKGRDYFGYKAIDSEGNYSQEATVIIKIEKQEKDVFYSDMDGRPEAYAAVALAENGLYIGEKIGNDYCFRPDEGISRGEFVSLCMQISGRPLVSGVLDTGYSDDDRIPNWMKSYVTAAALCGAERGSETEEGRVFNSLEIIDRSEAAEILDKAINISPVSYICLDTELDEETAQACANLSACGLLKDGTLLRETLSRAEAAEMLAAAMELIANR